MQPRSPSVGTGLTPRATPIASTALPVVTIDLSGVRSATRAAAGGEPAPPLHVGSALIAENASLYGILRKIDQGGMGVIYEGRDQRLNRSVAIKVMRSDGEGAAVRRFVEEAQVTSQLEHPNIVPLHELGADAEGRLFFAMKLVRGETLAEKLAQWGRSPLSARMLYESLTIIIKVCDALAFAHARGVIHRDLKPSNIMIGEYGEVLVMDWGIARVLSQPTREGGVEPTARVRSRGDASGPDTTTGLTHVGDIVGSPGYMSPEQARGDLDAIDERSDVFSLGAIVYEILSGNRAIAGTTVESVLARTADPVPPPRRRGRGPQPPPELVAVAMQAMAQRPDQRYQSARELGRDLQEFLAGRSVSARPDSFVQAVRKLVARNRALSLTIAIALLAIIAISTESFRRVMRQREEAIAARNVAVAALASRDQAIAGKLAAEQQRAAALEAESARSQRRLAAFTPYANALDLLARDGFEDEATRLLRAAKDQDPEFAEARFALGQALVRSDDPVAAALEFHAADALVRKVTGHPNLQALLSAAFAEDDAGMLAESWRSFVAVEELGKQEPLALVGRCFHLHLEDRIPEAMAAARAAVRAEPRLWETHFALGSTLELEVLVGMAPRSGPEADEAVAELRRAMAMAPHAVQPPAWAAKALVVRSPDERREARAVIDRLVEQHPCSAQCWYCHLFIHRDLGDDSTIQADSDHMASLDTATYMHARALAAIASFHQDWREMLAQDRLALRLLALPSTIAEYAIVCVNLGRRADAQPSIDDLHARFGDTLSCLRVDAIVDLRDGKTEEALAAADRGLAVAPWNLDFLACRARALFALGRADQATKTLDAIEAIDPAEFGFRSTAILILADGKRLDDARARLERLPAAFPDHAKEIDALRARIAAASDR